MRIGIQDDKNNTNLITMETTERIGRQLKNCLKETNLGISKKKVGKVRDIY